MAMRSPGLSRRWHLVVPALIGASSSYVAALVSFWGATGRTPPSIYGERSAMLSTHMFVGGLPAEYPIAIWFAAVAVWAASARVEQTRALITTTFLTAIPVLGATLWLAVARNFPCVTALTSAACAFVLLVTASLADGVELSRVPRQLASAIRDLVRYRPQACGLSLLMGLSALIAGAMAVELAAVTGPEASAKSFLRWYADASGGATLSGSHPAPVKVVVYSDYECPSCATAVPAIERVVQGLQTTFSNSIALEVADFPLSDECNPAVPVNQHRTACAAAVAVRLLGAKFGPIRQARLKDWFYRRASISIPDLRDYLQTEGILAEFDANYDRLISEVRRDAARGAATGVVSTPSVFVNGVKLPSSQPQLLEAVLRQELSVRGRTLHEGRQ